MADTNEPKSKIRQQRFQSFLSSLFGWRRSANQPETKQIGGMEFVSVDLQSDKRLDQGTAEEFLKSGPLTERLEKLFNNWLNDNDSVMRDIADRRLRVDTLTYAKLNDPFISRVVTLYGDEATQIDQQDHLIEIDSPDPRMTKEMYRLLQQWGVTQQRVKAACEHLAHYGDAFWANKTSEKGIERIIPLKQLNVADRLEFNPVEALEQLARHEGFQDIVTRSEAMKQLTQDLGDGNDFADIFDTKLFGYVVHGNIVVPPWNITHFRVAADGGEFYPFGTSPLLGTLAPFKLSQSTITLQSIARVMSFPVTLYKVKTSESADEARQFNVVNRVREEYDNIGVSATGGTSETYTINTKIWMPDGLMDVDVKSSQVDFDFVGDIEMYQDRVAVATGIPKGYLVQEWGGFGNSAISLVEQWKPFARAVYSIQSSFLEGLADLFRLHFAINGQFDFRTPFTLALKFPAQEEDPERRKAKSETLDMAAAVFDVVRAAIGAAEDEPLPPDIVRDILGKYTFLDPVDVIKWTRDIKHASMNLGDGEGTFGGSEGGESDFNLEDDLGDFADAGGADETIPDEDVSVEPAAESRRNPQNRLREQRLIRRYNEAKKDIYFQVLREQHIEDFTRNQKHVHVCTETHSSFDPVLKAVRGTSSKPGEKFQEYSIKEMLEKVKVENEPTDTLRE
jgi:hypothetical protein